MPEFAGVSHVGLSVTDIERSTAWYTDVLGFQLLMPTDEPGFKRVLLLHPPTGLFVGLVQHDRTAGGAFDESVPGLDHLAFAVADRDALVAWEEHLTAKGVPHEPINDVWYASVLVVRDPDGIALELFVRAG
jgi:catechol 2,3-dioxygenase-like lactoylglutathione lyase family enzyme